MKGEGEVGGGMRGVWGVAPRGQHCQPRFGAVDPRMISSGAR
jgi:hypothetical protein